VVALNNKHIGWQNNNPAIGPALSTLISSREKLFLWLLNYIPHRKSESNERRFLWVNARKYLLLAIRRNWQQAQQEMAEQ